MVYADTSFLVAIYLPEEGSERVLKWMQRAAEGLLFTPLHRHELRTGMRLRVFRGDMDRDQLKEAFREVAQDLETGVLTHAPIPWTDSFREAERLGEAHGFDLGIRSLDLLHVGIAQAMKARNFLTLDDRQRELAQAAGMRIEF